MNVRQESDNLSTAAVDRVHFSVDEGPLAKTKWFLHTADAHDLSRKFGFAEPGDKALERWSR